MIMMNKPTIVFDLDGTLVDTAPDLIDTLNRLFAGEGLPPIAFETGRNLIGGGVKRLIESALAVDGRAADAAEIDRLFNVYLPLYAHHIADRSRPFPGAIGALDALAARGYRLAVCTNKLEWLSLRLLDTLGLTARFAAICGQDTYGIQKPDPRVLRMTIAAAGGDAGRAVMVGDSATDIATARAAGMPVIAVDFGYTEIPVAQLGPDRIISHFDALADAVTAMIPGSR
jgi:phosphoglycolate phosphatase